MLFENCFVPYLVITKSQIKIDYVFDDFYATRKIVNKKKRAAWVFF